MRYSLLALLVAGLMAVAGYALVQPMQKTPLAETTPTVNMGTQTTVEAFQQTVERVVSLKIAVDSVRLTPGSVILLTTIVQNTGPEEVLLEYFIGQLFEVIIRDEAGTPVYLHSDTGFYKHLMAAPLHLRLAPGETHAENIEIKMVYSRGGEKGSPLPTGTYTLTVYLTAAVQGHPSRTIDGLKAYTSASIEITVEPQ